MLVWKATRTSLVFLVFNQREEAGREYLRCWVGRRKITSSPAGETHRHMSRWFTSVKCLPPSFRSLFWLFWLAHQLRKCRSVFARLRSRGRRHAEISQCQSLCYALISLCAVRQLRLSCKTDWRNLLLLQIYTVIKIKPFYLVHWFKMLRNKLVSVVVNLWRAHFDFIRYDGYFLYLITGKPVGTKWIEPTLHSCLIAFYLNSSEIDLLEGIY